MGGKDNSCTKNGVWGVGGQGAAAKLFGFSLRGSGNVFLSHVQDGVYPGS